MSWVRLLFCLVALLPVACGDPNNRRSVAPDEAAKVALEQRIAGKWKLTSYVPDEALSQALLLGIQTDQVKVLFEGGRLRSATPALQFDRRVRIVNPEAETFKVFVIDETGIEYEVWCQFDRTGRIIFESKTDPWKGHGMLEREGAAPAGTPAAGP